MRGKGLTHLDKIAKSFEVGIALLLLVVIAIKVFEVIFVLMELDIVIINMSFERILSQAFALVIGVEFVKMLFKLTPETVIDVLLFAIARQTVIYHERTLDLLIGAMAIAGLFAAKKYFIGNDVPKKEQKEEKGES
jgi:hypothetical protein